MAYGGPDSLEDVEPYLLNVRGGRPTPPELVAEIRARYAAIGGKSPLLEITRRQAQALERELNRTSPGNTRVFVGMRYWAPYIREAVEQIRQVAITQVTAMCMTPFFSCMSTGAYYTQLTQAIEAHDPESARRKNLTLRKIGHWYDHPGFVRTLSENVNRSLKKITETSAEKPLTVFTAHSLPSVLAEQGDPYAGQFAQLCSLVAGESGLVPGEWRACYQSAGARDGRWLGPSLAETLHRLAEEGRKSILVAPIGFLCDHVEVLYDIDIEAQQIASGLGMRLARTPSLNDTAAFITALADIVRSDKHDL